MHIYTHTHTHIYIYIYIYAHTHSYANEENRADYTIALNALAWFDYKP
jgi:hypothetical protein